MHRPLGWRRASSFHGSAKTEKHNVMYVRVNTYSLPHSFRKDNIVWQYMLSLEQRTTQHSQSSSVMLHFLLIVPSILHQLSQYHNLTIWNKPIMGPHYINSSTIIKSKTFILNKLWGKLAWSFDSLANVLQHYLPLCRSPAELLKQKDNACHFPFCHIITTRPEGSGTVKLIKITCVWDPP